MINKIINSEDLVSKLSLIKKKKQKDRVMSWCF